MAEVYDRWHKSRPRADDKPCGAHTVKDRVLVPSADHGKGKRWQVRWRDANGNQRKENFRKRTQADTRASTIAADLARGLYVDPAAGKESFKAVAERWRLGSVHRPTTAARVERGLRNHIYPTFGGRAVAGIRASEVQAWVKDRAQVLAPSTLGVTYSYLVSALRTAVRDGIIRANPCDGIRLPATRKQDVVPLDPEAVRALIDAAPERHRAMLLLAAASGLRQGEVFGLEVDGVDFLRREVKVSQQLVTPDDGAPYLGEPKTHESYRTVPLAQAAVDALAVHLQQFPPAGVEIDDRTNPRKPKKRTARLLFTHESGRAHSRGGWSHVWSRIVEQANKELAAGGEAVAVRVPEGTTMHDLRHFYASLLIRHREDVKTVQKRLGHAKPSITLDTYTHLWPDQEDTTRAAVEAVFSSAVPSLCPVTVAR